MKRVLILILLLGLCLSAEAAEKLQIRRITSSTIAANASTQAISTDNVASRLIFASASADHPSSNYTSAITLSIFDGTTERINLSTDHVTATFGPFTRENAPVFETDIDATLGADGATPMSSATFVYLELE